MRYILFYMIGMSLTNLGHSQKIATYDGVEMQLMKENRTEYYFGEPFRVFVQMRNTKGKSNAYHKYGYGFNLKIELKNQKTGQVIQPNANPWYAPIASGRRDKLKDKTPSASQAYAAGEIAYFYPHMEQSFGSVPLTKKEITGVSLLRHNLFAIPTGDYELTVTYYLYPSREVLTVKHKFKVIDVPQDLKKEFNDYINTTYYCNETRDFSKKTYSKNHVNSYESYFKSAKASVFKDYAMIDRTLVPWYKGITKVVLQKQRQEYLLYFSKIKRKDVGLGYIRLLPKTIRNEAKVSSKSQLQLSDIALKGALSKSYRASAMFITLSELSGVRGLYNQASEQ